MSIGRVMSLLLLLGAAGALIWFAVLRPRAALSRLSMPPALIAHRCGTADAPENTLTACRLALSYGVKKLWISVQITQDGIPVLYRPRDLSALTDGKGDIADMTYAQVVMFNAGWNFKEVNSRGAATYPYRNAPVHIPALEDVIELLPDDVEFFIDIKTADSARAAPAIAGVLQRHKWWNRAWICPALSANLRAFDRYPQARLFEAREETRRRLVTLALEQRCPGPPRPGTHVGFELRREVEVTEPLTLGGGTTKTSALLWNANAAACFSAAKGTQITVFGVNSEDDYRLAAELGADAVMVDSPKAASNYRLDSGNALRRLLSR